MKRYNLLLRFFLCVFTLGFVNAFSGLGLGTLEDPYQITNCNQLQEMNLDLAANYILMNNIDCSDTITWNGGLGFLPVGIYKGIGPFTGTLDGKGYTISDLYIHRTTDYTGLVGYGIGGSVSNLNLENVDITGVMSVGGLAGSIQYVNHCSVSGSVSGTYNVGGLVGRNYGTISNSYSTATAYGEDAIGGLVGYVNNGKIINSYSTGSVSGTSNVGGLVGSFYGLGTAINSFWDTETSGQSTSAGGIPKTTAEMMQQSTFAGWNFADVWAIYEGDSYPYFLLQILPTIDFDGDSYKSDVDCNDNDAAIYPGGTETCNGLDDDCDGQIDELDTDNDEVLDCIDSCPLENPGGYDADKNGCTDDIYGLYDILSNLPSNVISNGLRGSLLARVNVAINAFEREDYVSEYKFLNLFVEDLSYSKKAKELPLDVVRFLTGYAKNVASLMKMFKLV